MPVYYAQTDEFGVFCVDQIEEDSSFPGAVMAQNLARLYPDTIYFIYPDPDDPDDAGLIRSLTTMDETCPSQCERLVWDTDGGQRLVRCLDCDSTCTGDEWRALQERRYRIIR